jgi:hypothetical protein
MEGIFIGLIVVFLAFVYAGAPILFNFLYKEIVVNNNIALAIITSTVFIVIVLVVLRIFRHNHDK